MKVDRECPKVLRGHTGHKDKERSQDCLSLMNLGVASAVCWCIVNCNSCPCVSEIVS